MHLSASRFPQENLLVGTLVDWCATNYRSLECNVCTHPSGRCSGSCKNCSEEVNYHKNGNCRSDYDCQKFLYYYVCRYSWKYCSEIMYALEQVHLRSYPCYHIVSVGCGGAADLMAFEQINQQQPKDLYYKGYDINPLWEPIQNEIEQYMMDNGHCAKFRRKDIFERLNHGKPANHAYNIVVMEYLISHFSENCRTALAEELFEGIVEQIIVNRIQDSPFLIIINDIDHYSVRSCFDNLLDMLTQYGFHFKFAKLHFSDRQRDYNDGSQQYASRANKFYIPDSIKGQFDCAITCTSAQLIVEIR